jgi:hypothetical protein
MSRFRKALAAAAMAVATAGGGLLAAAAGAAPAHAATPAGGHTTAGFTAVPAAQAPGGIGPKFQCGDTCDPNGGGNPPPPPPPPTITCTISTVTPWQGLSGALVFHADTVCTGNVPQIAMSENVIHPPDVPRSDVDIETGSSAHTNYVAACKPGQWHSVASAYISPPAGWVIIAGSNPIVSTSPTVTFSCGGGSSGGCATGTPSVPAQPAARQPDVISCP